MRLVLFPLLLPLFWQEMQVRLPGRSARPHAPALAVHGLVHGTAACAHPTAPPPACSPAQNGYAWWETAAVMGTQASLVLFNCWFLVASWMRRR